MKRDEIKKLIKEAMFRGIKLNKEDFPEPFMKTEDFASNFRLIEQTQRAAYFIRERDAAKIAKFILTEDWKGLIRYSKELKERAKTP